MSLFGGVLGDRVERRMLIQFSQFANAMFAITVGFLILTNVIEWWHLMIVSTLQGCVFALQIPARTAAMSQLVPKPLIGNAMALNATRDDDDEHRRASSWRDPVRMDTAGRRLLRCDGDDVLGDGFHNAAAEDVSGSAPEQDEGIAAGQYQTWDCVRGPEQTHQSAAYAVSDHRNAVDALQDAGAGIR